MKREAVALLFFLLLPLALLPSAIAQEYSPSNDAWIYNSPHLILNTRMQIGMKIETSGKDARVESLRGIVDFYPRETPQQRLFNTQFTPQPKKMEDDKLFFEWEKPQEDMLSILLATRIRVENRPPRITKKIRFPLEDVPKNVEVYTKEAEIIDINEDIVKLASSLAEGEDDLVVIVDKIAAWTTQNIHYNLSTVTAEASQKASWVLKNKEGVCDELTALFIAMLRSLNIPARFVAGISYTNSPLFEEKWGPHGWAEVYYPGIGWVPYDVTYGEYGFVDPTHIVAKYSNDAGKITTRFSWRARNVNVLISPLTVDVDVENYTEPLVPRMSIQAEVLKGSVGFGSYNLVEATVTNLANYYQSIDVYLARTAKMTSVDPYKKHVLLKPNEARQVSWVVKLDNDLQKNYLYTLPVLVYTLGNVSSETKFNAVDGGFMLSGDAVMDERDQRMVAGRKQLAYGLTIQCATDKESYYTEERPKISCDVTNTGNAMLYGLRVCANGKEVSCETENLGITQHKQVVFEYALKPNQTNDVVITASNHDAKEQRVVSLQVKDIPAVEIARVQHPTNVSFDDSFSIVFLLQKSSHSGPKNVETTLELGSMRLPFTLDSLDGEQSYHVIMHGKKLIGQHNDFIIRTQWEDDLGRTYETTKSFAIDLNQLTASQQLRLKVSAFGNWLKGVFWKG